jgi:hypothetical protein
VANAVHARWLVHTLWLGASMVAPQPMPARSRVSAADLEKFKECFGVHDATGSGQVSVSDVWFCTCFTMGCRPYGICLREPDGRCTMQMEMLGKMLRSLGYAPTEGLIESLIGRYRLESLDFDQFLDCVLAATEQVRGFVCLVALLAGTVSCLGCSG